MAWWIGKLIVHSKKIHDSFYTYGLDFFFFFFFLLKIIVFKSY